MVDAAVELVEHPGGTRRALQQAPRGHDQVIVVERRAPTLGAGIAAGNVEAEPQQRQGVLDQRRAGDAVEHSGQPLGLAAQHAFDPGHRRDRGLGGEPRQDLALGGEERLGISGQKRWPALGRRQPLGDQGRPRDVLLAALCQRLCGGAQARAIEGGVEAGVAPQAVGSVIGRAAHLLRQPLPHAAQSRFVADARQQPGPFAQKPGHELGVFGDRNPVGHRGQCIDQGGRRIAAGQRLHLLVLGVTQQRLRLGLVEHLEARRHARLERKALQQRLAEGVDGEDVDAARRVEHAREQAARRDTLRRIGRAVDERLDLLVELGLRGERPASELGRQTVAHFGGGRLGEGEAKDALGLDAVQKQARHAIGQHLGLAGAGVGLDPGRVARRRGAPLRVGCQHERIERRAHSSPSPAVDHSATRSRWA